MKRKNFFKHGMIKKTALVVLSLFLLKADVLAFGLECWVDGKRYHYDITKEAALAQGFDANAATLLGWENDGLDVYMNDFTDVYNFMEPEWDLLHFDNLFNAAELENQWDRYLYGAFYGLLWAKEMEPEDPVWARRVAYNILSVTLHATQDFYAHSTWVNDPARRDKIFSDFQKSEIDSMTDLWTGKYEHVVTYRDNAPSYVKNHGGESFLFSLKDNEIWQSPAKLIGCEHEGNEGIALDRPCSAKIAFPLRDIPDRDKITSDALFQSAQDRAVDSSKVVLSRLEQWMTKAGAGQFWNSLKTYNGEMPPSLEQYTQDKKRGGPAWHNSFFDKHNKKSLSMLPFSFVGNGTGSCASCDIKDFYPWPGGQKWMFRIQIETDSGGWGGTGGDVTFHAVKGSQDKTFILDRVDYDDFGGGDNDAYYVGPVDYFPDKIQLTLDSQNGLQMKHLRVWAYRIGGQAAYGRLADAKDIRIGNDIVTEWTGPGGVIPVPATKSYKWEMSVNETQLAVFPFEISPYRELISATAVVSIPAITPEMLSTTRAFTSNLPFPLKAIYIYGDSELSGKDFQTVGVEYENSATLGNNLELGAYSWYKQPGMNNTSTYEYIPYEPQPLLPQGGLTRVTVRMTCPHVPPGAVSTEKLSVIIYKSQDVPLVEVPVDFSRSWSCP